MELSKKFSAITASPTLAITSKFKEMKKNGIDVVGFGAGEPDFDTPQYIKDAAIKAIEEGQTKYTPASGTPELKAAICRKFERENNLLYKPENIVVSNGAKHSLVNALCAILNPGDEVILPAPYWVSYPEMIAIADGKTVVLKTTEENDFKFTPDQLKAVITDKTKALILNSPSNPTGMIYTRKELKEIADIIVENDMFVISDEIYEHLIYEGERVSIASFGEEIKDRTIVINGLSKTFAMTGWRIGYTAANAEITKVMANLQSHAASNPNSIAQAASIAALDGGLEFVVTMKKEYVKRRNYMVSRINSMDGISALMPNGAFYVMMNIKDLLGKTICGSVINSADDFANALLTKANVALVPGEGFCADGYLRWSYATSMENIEKGLDRLEAFLKGNF